MAAPPRPRRAGDRGARPGRRADRRIRAPGRGRPLHGRAVRPCQPRLHRRRLRAGEPRRLRLRVPLRGGRVGQLAADPSAHRGAPANRYGRISWAAPPSSKIIGVSGEARLRNDIGQQARLSFLDSRGIEVGRIATGSDSPGGFEPFSRQLSDGGRDRFAASLVCAAGGGCRSTDQARTWIRSVRLTINDAVAPVVFLGGSLTEPGWHRGSGGLSVFSGDFGSGIRRLDVSVNGHAGRAAPVVRLLADRRLARRHADPALRAGADGLIQPRHPEGPVRRRHQPRGRLRPRLR